VLLKACGFAATKPEAQFIVPDWGDKVDYGIGLLVVPTRQATQAGGQVREPYAIVDFIPH
jgi:hypothetical protein